MVKKRLQRLGSWVVRRASGTEVPDATSGFRAYDREAAIGLEVVSKFTYTLESLIQAGKGFVAVEPRPSADQRGAAGVAAVHVDVVLRASQQRCAVPHLLELRAPAVFTVLAACSWSRRSVVWSPFLWDWIVTGDRSGHLQSIILGGVLLMAAIQVFALGVLADLIASHRTISQRTLKRVRRMELAMGVDPSGYVRVESADPQGVNT